MQNFWYIVSLEKNYLKEKKSISNKLGPDAGNI